MDDNRGDEDKDGRDEWMTIEEMKIRMEGMNG